MLVVKVVSPLSSRESFTVLGEDDAPVAPVERYLKYLTDIERSPNTVKAPDGLHLHRRARPRGRAAVGAGAAVRHRRRR